MHCYQARSISRTARALFNIVASASHVTRDIRMYQRERNQRGWLSPPSPSVCLSVHCPSECVHVRTLDFYPRRGRPGQYCEMVQRIFGRWIKRSPWYTHPAITRHAHPPTLPPPHPHLRPPWVPQRAHRQAWPSQVQTSITRITSTTVPTRRSPTRESSQSSQSPIWKTLAGAISARSSASRIKASMRPQNAPWRTSSVATGLASKSA